MPIYGYACGSCGHALDALQKVSEEPLVDCPECGDAALQRQLSAPRFRLKGKGWYETDFKSDNQRNLAGETDAAAASKDATGDKPAKDAKQDDKSKGSGTPSDSADKKSKTKDESSKA